jgi:hypothetical protein
MTIRRVRRGLACRGRLGSITIGPRNGGVAGLTGAPLKVGRRLEGGGSVRANSLKAKLEAGQRVEDPRWPDRDRLPTGPSRHSIAGFIIANHARP